MKTTTHTFIKKFPLLGLGGLLLFGFFGYSQDYDWQWAYRGGGNQNSGSNGSFSFSIEQIFDIKTDQYNNYYFAGTVVNYNPEFMGEPVTKYGTNATDNDIYIVSTDCEGNFRWHTTIGGHAGESRASIALDTLGGVYIALHALNSSRANNTAVPPHYAPGVALGYGTNGANPSPNNRRIVLIKYDTDGNYLWHTMPQDENVTATEIEGYFFGGGASYGIVAEPDGTLHWLCGFFPGNHLDGQLVIQPEDMPENGGVCAILKYDKDGNYLSHIPIPLNRGGGIFPPPRKCIMTGLRSGIISH